ncbi:MAG: BRCT domain-containing protein [Deltaproteobacteria bacterium]|nr:BRCT domain-containing protein [Deltaproteobacteria bacterium]
MTVLDEYGQPISWALNLQRRIDRTLDELVGLCKGMAADGRMVQAEAEYLLNWLQANAEARDRWPANVLWYRTSAMLEDGKLTPEEEKELLGLIRDASGPGSLAEELANTSSALPLNSPCPEINFEDKVFCFTGKFVFGTRNSCVETIQLLGGKFSKHVTYDVDYLVVGALGSRDWMHTAWGRKIEQAVEYRDASGNLAIVSEQRWTDKIFSVVPMG